MTFTVKSPFNHCSDLKHCSSLRGLRRRRDPEDAINGPWQPMYSFSSAPWSSHPACSSQETPLPLKRPPLPPTPLAWATLRLPFPPVFPVSAAALPCRPQPPLPWEPSVRIPLSLVNPSIFVGLAEGVCLYGLIISFMIIGSL